jgi:polysaccharide biosynthesis transport protein
MTTLPYQSPRVPRPVGSMATPVSAAGAANTGMTGQDVMRVLRGNIWLLLILVGVALGAGFAVNKYLSDNHSRYTANALCEISLATSTDPLSRTPVFMADMAMATEQRTQVQAMRSEALFSRALQNANSPIRNTEWFKSFASPSEARQDLLRSFSVNAIPETRLISVSMSYSRPEDARVVVQEVVDEHLRQQSQAALNRNFDRTQLLNTMKLRVEADLRAVADDRRDRAARLSQQGLNPSGGPSPKDIELDQLSKDIYGAQSELASIKGQLDSINTALQAGQDPPMVVRQAESDPLFLQTQNQLRDVATYLGAISGSMGSESPLVRDAIRRRDSLQQKLNELRTELVSKLKVSLVEDLQGAVKQRELTVAGMQKKLDELKVVAGEISNTFAQFRAVENREGLLRTNLQEINSALDQLQTGVGTSSSTIQWLNRPITPELPSFPKLSVTLSMAVTIALALGLAIAFIRELADTSIRSTRDLAKVGAINILGMVPHEDDDPQSAGARLPLVIAEAPQSMTAEQLRQFRTRLQHSASLDTTRSILVTSPNPGDGKTTIATNLAAGLALVGRRILLIDANFRRPELHKLFGMDNATGFTTVLSNPAQLAEVAKASKVPNLTVLSAGPKPPNATEMLESSLLTDFIEKALESYDHIIFDSGAILFASETVAMAPRVDGVITVVRAKQSTRGVVSRVKDMLRQVKAENLGVVLNGVRAYGGGYYSRNIKTYYEYSANASN